MVGEPTTFTAAWFTEFGDVVDAMPVLVAARALKTEQEIDAHATGERHCRGRHGALPSDHRAGHERERRSLRSGRGSSTARAPGWEGKIELALGFSLVWSGPGIKTFTATTSRPVVEGEPTLFEIWVCADGYWCDHTKNLVAGELTRAVPRARGRAHGGLRRCDRLRAPGREPRRARPAVSALGSTAMGFPGQPSHPICHGVGARAHEPPYAHQAGGGEIAAGMVLAIEPGCYIEGGGGLRVEDNFLITSGGAEKLSPFPDGIVAV